MGLLLSVLIACVGVVELLAFYSNIRRNFVNTATQTSLPEITQRYVEDLRSCNVEAVDVGTSRRYCLDKEEEILGSTSKRTDLAKDAISETDNLTTVVGETSQRQFAVRSKEGSKSPSPHLRQFIDRSRSSSPFDDFRRSPSPYPSMVLTAPRNSICTDHLDPTVEESFSKSPTPERVVALLKSKHNSAEFWANKIHLVSSKTRKSLSPSPVGRGALNREKSRSDSDGFAPSTSKQDDGDTISTAKTLTEAANVLKNVQTSAKSEPFWVNR